MPRSKLLDMFPWTTSPVVFNAPMAGFAGAALATAVSRVGGVGMIGSDNDMDQLDGQLEAAKASVVSSSSSDSSSSSSSCATFYSETGLLPLGVGTLAFFVDNAKFVDTLKRNPPALVWLFAARELADYESLAASIREACPGTRICIQVGNAAAATEVVRIASPDILVLQGADAGGHGFERGAGVISLVPETRDLLLSSSASVNGDSAKPCIVAAGGVTDGRGVASALALGAEGVVMGTAFLGAEETTLHASYRSVVLASRDGAVSTARAKVFDELRGPNIWPKGYDGRALTTDSWRDWQTGTKDIDTLRKLYAEAVKGPDRGYEKRAAVWAGTGIGLVNDVRPAAEIVTSVREGARKALAEAQEAL